jgi:hypothetical protein
MDQASTAAPSSATPLSADRLRALAPLGATLAALADVLLAFANQEPTPAGAARLEQSLAELTRQIGLEALSAALNSLEPDDPQMVPQEIRCHGTRYRRRKKTGWRVSCLFGQFRLRHFLFEPRQSPGESSLHPLPDLLGVSCFCTAALAAKAARLHARHPQKVTLDLLFEEHGVHFSESLLRRVVAHVALALGPHRAQAQAGRLVEALEKASKSTGSHLPVLCVGRDGVTIPLVAESYKEASVATVAAYDRRGRRLVTVYLGRRPEPGQPTLSRQLTELIQEVLRRWAGRPLRLAYVTDAGWQQQQYLKGVLRKLTDPADPKRRLDWEWVVDYYHAAGYVSRLAAGLFGDTSQARAWAARMRRLLKGPRGAARVLQSAGYWLSRLRYRPQDADKYQAGWNYLHNYGRWMDYARCRRLGIPLGSGVTEAACKVLVTQRLKNSGMRWKGPGGQVVLDLRAILLSGIWDVAWDNFLLHNKSELAPTYAPFLGATPRNTA